MLLWILPALAAPDLALVGNSYTQSNRLDATLAELLRAGGADPTVTALALPGYTFSGHLTEAANEGTRHHEVLATHTPPWGWLVLQEQSQIPGFPESNAELQTSVDSAVALDAYARSAGAETLFLMTWGRRDGDSANPDLYPDFLTMQALLAEGYLRYVAQTSTAERPTWVAPAGYAFRAVYEADLAAGRDPRAAGSDFFALYQEDGSHPSPAGSYLTACVIYAVVTGESPEGLAYDGGLADAAALQAVAAEVVFGDSPDILYPWEGGDSPPDSEVPDSEVPQDSDADDTGPEEAINPVKSGPCGCSTGGGPAALLPLLLPLLRRRSTPQRST